MADPRDLDGTEDADEIDGTAGDDLIRGFAGNDTLRGGAGDDTYRIDAAADRIVETVGNGFDVVRATAQVTLGAAEIEAVALEGAGNLRVTGNAFATEITGNAGSNILVGGGGGDTLTGGAGNDFFAFQLSDAAGAVTVTDFGAGDKLALDDRIFGLGDRGIDPRAVTAQQAASALRSEAFSYNRNTGELLVDLDARGGPRDPILIAVIEGGVPIGQEDVLLF
ncbi:hypothetical protein N9W17_05630 [Jannaschia sp.]|nr:hypothetical protein [Jannaschia sp.]